MFAKSNIKWLFTVPKSISSELNQNRQKSNKV